MLSGLEDGPIAPPPHPPTLWWADIVVHSFHLRAGVCNKAGIWLHGFANIRKGPQKCEGKGTGLRRSILCLLSMHRFCRRWPPERLRKICCEGSTRFLTFLQTAFGWICIYILRTKVVSESGLREFRSNQTHEPHMLRRYGEPLQIWSGEGDMSDATQ